MKLRTIVDDNLPSNIKDFYRQILSWSRKSITLEDNVDCQIIDVNLLTTETKVGHNLGRIPKYILPIMSYPNGIRGDLEFTKSSTEKEIYIKCSVAGAYTLVVM